MKIETTRSPSHASLVLRGDFETDAAEVFLATIDELLDEQITRVSVCFRYVKYLNSTALAAVMKARVKCEETGGDMVITRPSRLSREIVTKMGLDNVLAMFDDEDEAIDYLTGHGGVPDAPERHLDADQRNTVMFTFADDRAALLPGKRKHGVAVLDSITSEGIVFHWNPAQHDCDARTAAAMFRLDGGIRTKLQLKLARKDFFEADGTIRNVSHNELGDVTIGVIWTKISARDQQALKRHAEELAYLKRQTEHIGSETS